MSLIAQVLDKFEVFAPDVYNTPVSGSGAQVQPVTTSSGRRAFLKLTSTSQGAEPVAAAKRELRFYRDLSAQLPCRTPDLIDSYDGEDGVAILLTSLGQTVVPRSWSSDMWAKLGTQLALLHAAALPCAEVWHRQDPLLRAIGDPDIVRITAFWGAEMPDVKHVLKSTEEFLVQESNRQRTFTHGDCHTGNVAFLEGEPGLCDWQTAVIGRGFSDLAFLSVRAIPSGIEVPQELTAAYLDHRESDRGHFERCLIAEELATFLYLWPHFADLNTSTSNTRVRRRACNLRLRWTRIN